MSSPKVVAISGGFDPIHIGHVRMMREAAMLGDELVVIVNNDNWLRAKKGFAFMPEHERVELISAFPFVSRVILTGHAENDPDRSVCKALVELKPHVFANGGDRFADNIPEAVVCKEYGIETVFNVGEGGKVQSSSWMIESAAQALQAVKHDQVKQINERPDASRNHKGRPKTKSLLRRLEYETLRTVSIDGAILDIGGSKKSGYHELIGGEHTFTVGNIDASYGLDLEFDAEKPWPVADGSYNGVLLINVIEHLFRYEHALAESYRALAEEGVVIGVVPFMLNIHAAPRDFFRYSRFTLERLLTNAGFVEVEVRELGTGLFSVLYQSSITLVPRFLATPLIALARGLDGLVDRLRPGSALSKRYMPLGYYFEARKH